MKPNFTTNRSFNKGPFVDPEKKTAIPHFLRAKKLISSVATLQIACFCMLVNPSAYGQEKTNPFDSKTKKIPAPAYTVLPSAKNTEGLQSVSVWQANQFPQRSKPILQLQSGSLNQHSTTNNPFQVKRSAQTGLPIFIQGQIQNSQPFNKNARVEVAQASYTYLDAVKEMIQIHNPGDEFEVNDTQTDELKDLHIRMKQVYKGVEVYGSEVILHSRQGAIHSLNGRYFPTPQIATVTPAISREKAIQAAIQSIGIITPLPDAVKHLYEGEGPAAKLIIYHAKGDLQAEKLAWQVSVRADLMEHWEYFIDATTGKVIHKFNQICSIDGPKTASAKDLNNASQTVNTYQFGNNYYLMDAATPMFNATQSKFPNKPVGILWTLDAKNTFGNNFTTSEITSANNLWNHPVAISAHANARKAYEYYKNVHGRNGIDGKGGNIISIVNVTDKKGKSMDNAYWDGKAMYYGNGNIICKPLAGSMDVAGHEMTHGVVQHSAKLEYQGQSGAMNESFADIFGAMMDKEDWQVGEDIMVIAQYPTGAMRDLSNPHNGGNAYGDTGYQPKEMSEFYTGDDDNGGVHTNSGIPNHAYYKFATAISKEKAEKVYYRALTTYLTATSQFIDLRLAVVQAATDLHGAESPEVAAAKTAFDEVGIFESAPTDPVDDLPTNPGQDFILLHDASADNSDPNSIYIIDPDGSDLQAKSTTEAKRKPSVTDDGSFAVFVANDSKIWAVNLTGIPKEFVVHDQAIWDNVAISKDGTKMAAISTSADTTIYVYDFGTEEWHNFKLYNPTYSGIDAAGVLFADAIEWDHSGEYLLYDAYNVISKSTGEAIDYWDVGTIKVWDNNKQTFGDGKIMKVFNSLPADVSIGNPSYSKNSPNICAFDYMNAAENRYEIIGANLETGKTATILVNNTLGYPTYSRLDDKLAYTSIGSAGDTVVAVINLKADKINANGNATVLVNEGKWAVWYAAGERVVLSSDKDMTSFKFQLSKVAVSGTINGTDITVAVPANLDVTKLIASFTHSNLSTVKIGQVSQISGATKNDFTNPVTYTVVAQNGSTKNYKVTVTKGTTTGVGDDNDESDKVTLYPNPNNGQFKLKLGSLEIGTVQVEIFNAIGVSVYQQAFPPVRQGEEVEISLANLPHGVYFMQMSVGEKAAYKKLVIR